MSKRKRRAIKNQIIADSKVSAVIKELRLPDLQRECIMRGMAFQVVCDSSIPKLNSFLVKNWDNSLDRNLITEFDVWMDNELKSIGREDLIHPMLSLGHTENKDTGQVVKRKIKPIKPQKKKKRERTNDGIFKGTKKAYTYELAKQGIPKPEAIKMVKEKFPEANEKSVSIWYNKAKKLAG